MCDDEFAIRFDSSKSQVPRIRITLRYVPQTLQERAPPQLSVIAQFELGVISADRNPTLTCHRKRGADKGAKAT